MSIVATAEVERADGSVKVVDAVVGDDTGTVILSAVDDQCELLVPGVFITVRNGKVTMVCEKYPRLTVDAWGTILQGEAFEADVDLKNNLSDRDFKAVK